MMANTIAARKREPGEIVMVSSAMAALASCCTPILNRRTCGGQTLSWPFPQPLAAEHGLPEAKAEGRERETAARLIDRAVSV